MGIDFIIEIVNQGVLTLLMIASPMLISGLVIGIMVSIFQAVTQINEQTLSFIPKIVVVIGAMVLSAPMISDKMTTFTRELIIKIPEIIASQ
jgi:flagellar biosynthesis protein FliQ